MPLSQIYLVRALQVTTRTLTLDVVSTSTITGQYHQAITAISKHCKVVEIARCRSSNGQVCLVSYYNLPLDATDIARSHSTGRLESDAQ